jgi:hypothetical protein
MGDSSKFLPHEEFDVESSEGLSSDVDSANENDSKSPEKLAAKHSSAAESEEDDTSAMKKCVDLGWLSVCACEMTVYFLMWRPMLTCLPVLLPAAHAFIQFVVQP